MATKANRTRAVKSAAKQATKRIEKAKKEHGLAEVNPGNPLLVLACKLSAHPIGVTLTFIAAVLALLVYFK